MYAVIETGGKQYRVEVGTQLEVELLDVEPGATINLDRVLLVADGDTASIGQPVVTDAQVSAEVVSQIRGPKTISFKYRPKARSRVKKGHRQELTVLRISDIVLAGKSAAADSKKAADAAKTERDAGRGGRRRTGRQGRRARREAGGRRRAGQEARKAPKKAPAKASATKTATKAEAAPRQGSTGRQEARPPRRRRHRPRLRPRPMHRRRSPPAPPRRTSRPDGTQEGRRQRQERPRQRRPATRRQGRRRPDRQRRLDHRPPARDDLPVGSRDRDWARTTPCSRSSPAR